MAYAKTVDPASNRPLVFSGAAVFQLRSATPVIASSMAVKIVFDFLSLNTNTIIAVTATGYMKCIVVAIPLGIYTYDRTRHVPDNT